MRLVAENRLLSGRNEYCIDKNYGGTLCVFDRMFGTFQEEIEEIPIVFGLTHSINTFDSLEANVINWRSIFSGTLTLPTLRDKFFLWYDGPGVIAGTGSQEQYTIPPCTLDTVRKYDPYLPPMYEYHPAIFAECPRVARFLCLGVFDTDRFDADRPRSIVALALRWLSLGAPAPCGSCNDWNSANVYLIVQFFIILVAQSIAMEGVTLKHAERNLSLYYYCVGFVCMTLASLSSFGAMTDRRTWSSKLETVRLVVTAIVCAFGLRHFSHLIPDSGERCFSHASSADWLSLLSPCARALSLCLGVCEYICVSDANRHVAVKPWVGCVQCAMYVVLAFSLAFVWNCPSFCVPPTAEEYGHVRWCCGGLRACLLLGMLLLGFVVHHWRRWGGHV